MAASRLWRRGILCMPGIAQGRSGKPNHSSDLPAYRLRLPGLDVDPDLAAHAVDTSGGGGFGRADRRETAKSAIVDGFAGRRPMESGVILRESGERREQLADVPTGPIVWHERPPQRSIGIQPERQQRRAAPAGTVIHRTTRPLPVDDRAYRRRQLIIASERPRRTWRSGPAQSRSGRPVRTPLPPLLASRPARGRPTRRERDRPSRSGRIHAASRPAG